MSLDSAVQNHPICIIHNRKNANLPTSILLWDFTIGYGIELYVRLFFFNAVFIKVKPMKGFVSGNELMKRWKISPYEFLDRFLKQGLIVYSDEGRELSPEELFYGIEDQRDDTDKIMAWKFVELPGLDKLSQQMLAKLGDPYFDEINVQGIELAFDLAADADAGNKAKYKPIHHTEIHMLKIRAVAAELWAGKYKDLSVPELINTQEMKDANRKSDGRTRYSVRTIKNWIKDLCPNPPLMGAPKKK